MAKSTLEFPFPPSYVREVWDYSSANAENIQKAALDFDWEKAFRNLSVDRKVDLLNEALLNILRNYIPNKKLNSTIANLHGGMII